MNNNQVCHLWANQRTHAAKGSNLFFEDETIYSYGLHFPIATFTDKLTIDGARLVLFNARSYSVTTGKHKGLVRSALQGLNVRVIDVPYLDCLSHAENMAYFEREHLDALIDAKRARLHAYSHIKRAQALRDDAIAYVNTYGLSAPEWILKGIDESVINAAIEKSKQAAKHSAEMRKLREAREAMSYAEKLAAWLNAETSSIPYKHGAPIYLRNMGRNVETSQGASVTIINAHKLYRLVSDARGTSDAYRFRIIEDMPEIDGFDIRKIHENGDIQIGCHFLTWEIINDFAINQKWVTA